MGTRGSFPGIEAAWYKADHLPPSYAKAKNGVLLSHMSSWRGA
jgi:hypothetical protein